MSGLWHERPSNSIDTREGPETAEEAARWFNHYERWMLSHKKKSLAYLARELWSRGASGGTANYSELAKMFDLNPRGPPYGVPWAIYIVSEYCRLSKNTGIRPSSLVVLKDSHSGDPPSGRPGMGFFTENGIADDLRFRGEARRPSTAQAAFVVTEQRHCWDYCLAHDCPL